MLAELKLQFPHLRDHVKGYMDFVLALGGLNGVHFQHWKHADNRFTSHKATLRGSLLTAIADLPVQFPHIKRAVALAARLLPKDWPRPAGGLVDWFKVPDVKKIGDMDIDRLKVTEGVLIEMHKECSDANLPDKMLEHFYCRSEARVARLICEKKDKTFPEFEAITDIVEELKMELKEFKDTGRMKPRTLAKKSDGSVVCNIGRAICM